MSGADAFPYPDDDPGTVRGLGSSLSGASGSLRGAVSTVRGARASLQARWTSPADTLAVAEVDAVGDLGDDGVTALADAQAPLDDYATALDTARGTIDGLRTQYDDAEADYQTALDGIQNSSLSGPMRQDDAHFALQARDSRIADLTTQYDEAISVLESAARSAGGALSDIAGRISPAPASLNGDLARAHALDVLPFMSARNDSKVTRAGEHIIVDTSNGNDDVRITRDPRTGGVVVTINGLSHFFSPSEAGKIVVRTNGGSDVIEVEPGMSLGFTMLSGGEDDLVAGGGGNDVIRSGEGNDDVIGGQGNDAIDAGGGHDNVSDALGVAGAAALYAKYGGRSVGTRQSGGNDVVAGGRGNDTIDAGDGHNRVLGGSDDDTISTGTGNDIVDGGSGADVISTGEGNDRIDGGADDDSINAGGGDDNVAGGDGDDTIDGSAGNDHIDGGEGSDTIRGGTENDTITGGTGEDTIYAGAGNDSVDGGDDNDYIDGFTGDDTIAGGKGDDVVYAGEGNDRVDGGADNDYIDGYRGNDSLSGGTGDDVVSGGGDDDTLAGDEGDDVIYTGDGRDSVTDRSGYNKVFLQAEDAADVNAATRRVEVEIARIPVNIHIQGSPEFRARVLADLETLASSPTGRQMLEQLAEEGPRLAASDGYVGDHLTIVESPDRDWIHYDGDDATIRYDPEYRLGGENSPVTLLYHELAHSYDNMSGNLAGVDGGTGERWYTGPDPNQVPVIDRNGDGRISRSEVDRDGDGDIDDNDLDVVQDGKVDERDEWVENDERQAVGLPIDHDQDPDTPAIPADDVPGIDHPYALTENALREEMGDPRRDTYD